MRIFLNRKAILTFVELSESLPIEKRKEFTEACFTQFEENIVNEQELPEYLLGESEVREIYKKVTEKTK